MNVTKDGFKDRQFHMEDYLQTVSAEQNECAEVSVYQRITENKHINTDFWTDNLLELILREEKCTPVRRRKAGYQRAHGGKLPATIVETSKAAEKREEKCTPAGSLPNICRGRMILFPTAPFFRDIILKNRRYFQSSRRRTSSVNAILWA